MTSQIETDYLIVGCGAAGMAFADALITESDAQVVTYLQPNVPASFPLPPVPIFGENTITLQPIRTGASPFAAAITAYIEATREDTEEKNRLCPPNAYMDVPTDLIRNTLIALNADYQWNKHPDIAAWLQRSRLNVVRGIAQQLEEPRVQYSLKRFAENAQQAAANLQRLQTQLMDGQRISA